MNLTEYKGSTENEANYTKGNLLMPTTQSDGTTISSIPTTVFEDDGTTVKARNYGFYLKKTYEDTDHKTIKSDGLYFMRVRNWSTADNITEAEATKRNTPTAERAYLQLPANTYGGTTYGKVSHDSYAEKWDDNTNARFFNIELSFDDEDPTTAISSLPTQPVVNKDNRIYTMMGTIASGKLSKGIYIQNGKKFVIR
ncbi:MAG: hypothetical protein PUF37_09065 [Prevotellaceae bacterium]|nr:hypothetical protein [Prevotellaceae bacterium]